MARKKWSATEKLAILQEVKVNGVTETLRKHEIHYGTYYSWKQKFEIQGESGLEQGRQQSNPEIKRLQIENMRLKQLLADKELALMVKEELLKKTLQVTK